MLLNYNSLLLCCIIFISVKSFQLQQSSKCFNNLILETQSGKLKGNCKTVTISIDNTTTKVTEVYSWLSVPYAQPPIDELRFKPPLPVKTWADVLDATKVSNSCMQIINRNLTDRFEFTNVLGISKNSTSKISEDCLYLNIYIPADVYLVKTRNNERAPIVVFFHGGDGEMGSGLNDIYDPSIFASMTGTIFITINYRLGIFGFLYLKEKNRPQSIEGNQAILDQNLALRWINDNAQRFNGDNTRITLLGHESGAKFIGYHLLYKPSWPLFRNVIMLSGSPVHLNRNFLTADQANARANFFLKRFYECGEFKLSECIRNIDALNLTITSRFFLNKVMSNGSQLAALNMKTPFLPVVDNLLFRESPIRSFRTGNFKKCNVILSFNSHDGGSLIPFNYGALNESTKQSSLNYTHLSDFIKKFYNFYPTWPNKNSEIILNSILNEYTRFTLRVAHNQRSMKPNYFQTLSKILTDESFACPDFKLMDYLTKFNQSDVYLFILNSRLSTSKWPMYYGVVNSEILPIVFGQPFNSDMNNQALNVSLNPWKLNPWRTESRPEFYTPRDKQISKDIIIRLANFIRDDTPNSRMANLEKIWPEFKPSTIPFDISVNETSNKNESLYLMIKQNSTTINKLNIHQDSCHLWNNLIPSHLDVLAEMKMNSSTSDPFLKRTRLRL